MATSNLNEEQKEFLLNAVGGRTLEEMFLKKDLHEDLAHLAVDGDSRQLLNALMFTQSTTASSKIIRQLLEKAGTDCNLNDNDPFGDGDQRMVTTGEAEAQILREIFAQGGDLEHWLREYPSNNWPPLVWSCIKGDPVAVEKELRKIASDFSKRRELLEQRVTSMRLSPLILTVGISKHPQTVYMYTKMPLDQMDHLGVFRVLLQYGARPNAKEVTGKTVCHYGAGALATKDTLLMTDMAIKANNTCTFVGENVILDGLLKKPEYNGMEGILGGFDVETERRVFHPSDPNIKELAVKPDNVFVVMDGSKGTKMCILDKSLIPPNLITVQDRLGSISLHEVAMSQRDDVAEFILKHSPKESLDVKDYAEISPRLMVLQPNVRSKMCKTIREHLAKVSEREESKALNKTTCEHCSLRFNSKSGCLQCTGCLDALYCSKECQRADWKAKHKKECPEREKRQELVLGEPMQPQEDVRSFNYRTGKSRTAFKCRSPKGSKPNQKFWVKVQSNGIEGQLLIYDETRYCNFYLAPGRLGHKELVEKVAEQPAFMGRKSFFKAKIDDQGKCVVFPHTSTILKW